MHWRRKWQPTPVFLPGESQGWGSLVGCRLWGHTESDTTEATWRQQQQYVYRLYSIKSYYKIKAIVPCNIKYILDAYLFYTHVCHAKSLQSCPTLCNPIHHSLPGSCVHGLLQARILEWITMPSSRVFTLYNTMIFLILTCDLFKEKEPFLGIFGSL